MDNWQCALVNVNMPFAPSTLILGLALLLLFGAIVVIPLLDRKRPAVQPPSPLEALERERAAAVRAIRELDFDHRTHKINDDDYKQLRETQVTRGAQILRELEALQTGGGTRDVNAEIEAAVQRLRAKATRACTACGAAVRADDNFCPQCGAKQDQEVFA
jgi:zinc-ribbon domain